MFQKVVQSAKLVSLPDIYMKLKELIAEPDYTMAEVALLVGYDPGMATRFLRAVNNPLNRRTRMIETVSHAVSLLGMNQVHDIVLSASVTEAFAGFKNNKVMNMKKFWRRSLYCAVIVKQLAIEIDLMESDRLFVIGLVHDIGHLIMYTSIPEESQHAALKAKEKAKSLYQVEREELGFDYAALGGYMMKQWDLPESFQTITRFHPEPPKADQLVQETALLYLSSLLVMSEFEEENFGEGRFAVDPNVWSTSSLTVDQCLNVRLKAADQLAEVENSIFNL